MAKLFFLAFLYCHTVAANPLLVPHVSSSPTEPSRIPNVHHVFNAIHSSMRQWGSSRNHNGMSFFLATVPQGTQFYHGTGTPFPVTAMEWLAFEPEHAMNFAIAIEPPPEEPPKKSPQDPGDADDEDDDFETAARFPSAKWLPAHEIPTLYPRNPTQQPLGKQDPPSQLHRRPHFNITAGWLHTYQAKQDLHLLYIDGMAAAKSGKGTLDTQDHLLLKNAPPPARAFADYDRALKLCSLARDRWAGRVDGFVRMEHGFEIIMCSFTRSLDLVRVTRARRWTEEDDDDADSGGFPLQRERDRFSFWQAITARYHSIGGHRVALNYDHFVSAFAYGGLDLFEAPGAMPRLRNASGAALDAVVADVDRLVLEAEFPGPSDSSSSWQAVADEIVTRYAKRLQTLASGKFATLANFKLEVERLFYPFVDFDARDGAAEVERCSLQFIPSAPQSADRQGAASYGRRVVRLVAEDICTTLYATTKTHDVETAIGSVEALMKRLGWTVWKECLACAADEVCMTPIWPYGSVEEYENPRCINATGFADGFGYWDERLHRLDY